MRHYEEYVPAELGKYLTDGTHKSIQKRYSQLKEKASNSFYDAFDEDVVVVDTETTGLSFDTDELIQIAAARVKNKEIVDWFITFVNPGKEIPDETTHLTGISQGDVRNAPSVGEALENLVEFIGDSYIVAHNIGFDRTFLTKHVEGYSLIENTWIDTLDLARIALPRMSSHRLKDLAEAFGCPASTHRADADVESTCAVLRILLAAVEAMPENVVVKISQLAKPDDWSTVAVFDFFTDRILAKREIEDVLPNKKLDISTLRKLTYGDNNEKNANSAKNENKTNAEKTSSTAKAGTSITNYCRIDAKKLRGDAAYKFKYPSDQDIASAFSESGCVGTLYENYEQREEQVQMAQSIAKAISTSQNLTVEAGTGVGKSMAYLVPLIKFAKANNITVGVATKTNTLLDQLVFNELPALSASMGGVKYSALKGQANYVCMRKASDLINRGGKSKKVREETANTAPALATLISFIEQTAYDDADTINVDYKLLSKYEYTTTSNECLKYRCPFYNDGCFVFGARANAMDADVVVTNHSMLFSDIKTEGNLLPPIRYWVIDEAHRTEEEARNAFTHTVSSVNIQRLKRQFLSDDSRVNPFLRAERVMDSYEDEKITLFYAMLSKSQKLSADFSEVADKYVEQVKELLAFEEGGFGKPYESVQLWLSKKTRESNVYASLKDNALKLSGVAEKITKVCQEIATYLEGKAREDKSVRVAQGRISSVAFQCSDLVQAIDVNFVNTNTVKGDMSDNVNTASFNSDESNTKNQGDFVQSKQTNDQYVYAAKLYRNKEKYLDEICAMPINVGDVLNKTLFEDTYSVIFTSATLSTEKNFNSITDTLGLNQTKQSNTRYLLLNSSYNFNKNMKIYIPTDIPEPASPVYLDKLQDMLIKVHQAQCGSVLSLFTNRRDMEKCYLATRDALKADGLSVLCQRKGLSTKSVKDEFLKDKSVSLFALKSFWEGFDAPGDTLRGVVIPRLPFSKPNDPLMCERRERDQRAWFKYALPASIIEVKQAVGRLIRKADDTGNVILADHRIISKSYGKAFINSLPSNNVAYLTVDEIAQRIKYDA